MADGVSSIGAETEALLWLSGSEGDEAVIDQDLDCVSEWLSGARERDPHRPRHGSNRPRERERMVF